MIKRIFYFIWFYVWATTCVCAQELTVRSMSHRQTDLSARSHVRNDQNGEPCALVRVEFPLEDVVFDGNVVGGVERHVNEYWVYMTAGSKTIEIKHPKFYTLEVMFVDYDIQRLEGLQSYKLIVNKPQIDEQDIRMIQAIDEAKANLENGHEYVDLGLPSGILWATCNIGASYPEEFGDSFAWGATKPQKVYDFVHTPYQTKSSVYSNGTKWSKYLGSTTSSYKASKATDSDAMKTILDPEDDAAHVNWGGSWRMPRIADFEELRDTTNCIWIYTTQNGIYGYKVTSKKNSNSLFLPAAGCRTNSLLYEAGTYGFYWTSLLLEETPYYAYYFYFTSTKIDWGNDQFRSLGQSIRPVCTLSR